MNKTKKITFLIYSLEAGGAERAVCSLANFWVINYDVTIITLIKTVPFYDLNPKIKLQYCLENSKYSTTLFQSLRDAYLRIGRLTKLLREQKSDVVISFMTKTNIYTIWVAKWLHIPCIVSERSNHEMNRLPKSQEILRNITYKFLTRLVVQTQGNKRYYKNFVPRTKINIIPNGIAEKLQKKRGINLNKKERFILNVGAFRNGKSQDLLIRAFAAIKPRGWKIIFLGKGPNLEKHKALAETLGVSEHIHFKGAQKDVAFYYNNASMFVFTSEHEGFPNALLEALYFGLPSISTNCPHGPSDLIENGVNGFLIPVGNQKLLEKKLLRLMNDEELRNSFSKQAIEQSKKYEIEPIAEQWMEVIKSVIV